MVHEECIEVIDGTRVRNISVSLNKCEIEIESELK